ncbi:MAG: hypothetical protein ABL959_08490 [Pyrinomonadaceae bacterium]
MDMAITNDWLPGTLAGLREMFSNVKGKITGYQADLGLSAGALAEIILICNEFLAAYDYVEEADATGTALREWRRLLLYGTPIGDAAPDPPAFGTVTMPVGSFLGIIAKFREYRAQMVAASGYTLAIGEDLMIVKSGDASLIPAEVVPAIHAFPAQSDYLCSIVVNNRAESDQWIVQVRPVGGEWSNVGTFTGKSADITITPSVPGKPEQIEIRVQLRKSNQNYGQFSLIVTVTVNP